MMTVLYEYKRWYDNAVGLEQELASIKDNDQEIEDAFRCELSFGTAGLRGIIGAGPNRMNVYTVGKATQGLATYLVGHFSDPSVVIMRDSRNFGESFVATAAGVLAANGVKAIICPRPAPTPLCSFAVRHLGCSAGINVTASHNPAQYNGYKVYGDDGCQIASDMADAIQESINNTDFFSDIKQVSLDEGVASGMITWLGQEIFDAFISAVQEQSLDCGVEADPGFSVVYTPLNGVGLECVSRILDINGIENVTVVPEQAQPNGDFPTCAYPNPEERAALQKGLELCEQVKPDLLLATDPDADRVGIAVPHNGEYVLLTGNEVGVLLADYIARARKERGEDLSQAVMVSTIVSTAMIDALAADYGFQVRRTLTGFKHIGGQIALLEEAGQTERFALGFEESYGYLVGTHVRDKDAIVASMLICQMARYHAAHGKDLAQVMEELYQRYGYYKNRTISLSYPGAAGATRMKELTAGLRANAPEAIAGLPVVNVIDYAQRAPMPILNALDGEPAQTLPTADVIEFQLEGGSKVLIRPSGTEPKIKAYIFALEQSEETANALVQQLEQAARELLS